MSSHTFRQHGSYEVYNECIVCHVLVAPDSRAHHEATPAHQLNATPARYRRLKAQR
jgi:hypothetical protein